MDTQIRVLKLGGSLIEECRAIIRCLCDYAAENNLTLLIIPGGGPFAMTVRNLAGRVSDETAHWMAVLAMHQYGLFIADTTASLNNNISLIESLDDLPDEGVSILLPYKILRADDCLPHSWDVTSDTIAAFITHKLGDKGFIKLTDVDGILDAEGRVMSEVSIEAAMKMRKRGTATCIDNALPAFLLRYRMYCIIVNGRYPHRVRAVLEGKCSSTCCTRLG